jgi:hypothetical protein
VIEPPPATSEPRERALPVWAPWAIAVLVIVVAAFAVLWLTDEPPVATGEITKVFAVQQPGAERVLAGVELRIRNATDKELLVRHVEVAGRFGEEEFKDTSAAAGDYPRYFQALPDLKQSDAPPLPFETRIAAGAERSALLLVTFPVNRERFDQRTDLRVNLGFYGRKPVVFAEAAKK